MLPIPPGSGLPRANERRVRDNQEDDQSDTSVQSVDDDSADEYQWNTTTDQSGPNQEFQGKEPQPLNSNLMQSQTSLPTTQPGFPNFQMNGNNLDPWGPPTGTDYIVGQGTG